MAILLWLAIALMAAIALGTRFSHPDMSETRLLIDFWPRWLFMVAIACGVVWLSRRAR